MKEIKTQEELRQINKNILEIAVKDCDSYHEMCVWFRISPTEEKKDYFKKLLNTLKINTRHFINYGIN